MDANKFDFKLGDKTNAVWNGDMTTECEYIANLGEGRMLFYDVRLKCFRKVFIEISEGKPILNGWRSAYTPSELL
jgi:hypothetical protein